jgi:hypothetical protein
VTGVAAKEAVVVKSTVRSDKVKRIDEPISRPDI